MADYMTLAQASRAVAAGTISPIDLTEQFLDKIKARNGELHAFITVTETVAREQARAADAELRRGTSRGKLHGLPVAFKDIFDTAGILTTGHSRLYENRVPAKDATSVAKMKDAGTVCLGKLATHEFAFGGPSPDLPWPLAVSPWDPTRFTGGSSSGSGVAVSAGLALGAFGSDTGGSIRLPAAYCGLVGIKPTYGRVSRVGVHPLAFSLDHVGPMAWTAEDCALMLDAMAGYDAADPGSADVPVPVYSAMLDVDLSGIRIGVARQLWEEGGAGDEVVTALEAALKVFARLGATIVEVTLPSLDEFGAAGRISLLSEAYAVHEETMQKTPHLFGELLRRRLYLASTLSAADYVQSIRKRKQLCDAYAAATQDVDVVFTACTAGPAPKVEEMTWEHTLAWGNLTMPFNVTGSPALSTRAGFSSTGLPLAFQLVGKPFAEATLLALAHAYEKATDWADTRPA